MKRIQMPSSYAVVPDGEKALLGGGGAFRDAWTSFTDHLRFTDRARLQKTFRPTRTI